MSAETLDALAREVLDATARRNPGWATETGYPGYDELLAPAGRADVDLEIVDIDRWRASLPRATGADPIDREALDYALRLRRFDLAERRRWRRDPDHASRLMDHLLPLLIRRSRPLDARVAAMTARLEKAPQWLLQSRLRVEPAEVPPLWLKIARETVDASPPFLAAVHESAVEAPAELRARLDRALAATRDAFEDHTRWLGSLESQAKGAFSLGEEAFDELMRLRLLGRTAKDLDALGRRYVEETRAELRDAAFTVIAEAGRSVSEDPVHEALAIARRDHPSTFEAVLDLYRKTIEEARAFVVAKDLATVPPVPLDVVETPPYLRHVTPFAAYIEPARFDADPRGTYLVTPKMDLSAFNVADVRTTTVHEAYPGHHLQLSVANTNPSVARILVGAVETVEGWALYCEGLLGRHGFTSTPKERFIRAKDQHWRAVRILADVGLHTGRLTYDDATRLLVEETAMTREEAEAEVKRYTLDPGYNLSYFVGKKAIEALRAKYRDASDRAFHDALMRAGSLPIPLLDRAIGETLKAG